MRTLTFLCFSLLFLIGIDEAVFAQSRDTESYKNFIFRYEAPRSARYQTVASSLARTRALERPVENATRKILPPEAIVVSVRECGSLGAFYDTKTDDITLCYEFIQSIFDAFSAVLYPKQPSPTNPDLRDGVMHNGMATILFVLLHEYGHGLIHRLDLPIVGREEDAADEIAAIMLLQSGDYGSTMTRAVVTHFSFLAQQLSKRQGPLLNLPYWNEHSLDAQRMYDITCLLYGSNPAAFAFIVGKGGLPNQRAQNCPADYVKKVRAWNALLKAYLRESLLDD